MSDFKLAEDSFVRRDVLEAEGIEWAVVAIVLGDRSRPRKLRSRDVALNFAHRHDRARYGVAFLAKDFEHVVSHGDFAPDEIERGPGLTIRPEPLGEFIGRLDVLADAPTVFARSGQARLIVAEPDASALRVENDLAPALVKIVDQLRLYRRFARHVIIHAADVPSVDARRLDVLEHLDVERQAHPELRFRRDVVACRLRFDDERKRVAQTRNAKTVELSGDCEAMFDLVTELHLWMKLADQLFIAPTFIIASEQGGERRAVVLAQLDARRQRFRERTVIRSAAPSRFHRSRPG